MLELIDMDGNFSRLFLNKFVRRGWISADNPQKLLAGCLHTGDFTLVGCSVTPGFEFEDFKMTEQEKLAERYNHIAAEIMADPSSERALKYTSAG